jgi:hypothetical protein
MSGHLWELHEKQGWKSCDTVDLITNQEEVVLPRSLLSAGRVISAHGGGQTPAQQTANVEQAAGAV